MKANQTYLQECAFGHAIAWLRERSSGSMCRRPFRNRSSRTCTCARFPRIFCVDACVVEHQEWGLTSKPVKVAVQLAVLRMFKRYVVLDSTRRDFSRAVKRNKHWFTIARVDFDAHRSATKNARSLLMALQLRVETNQKGLLDQDALQQGLQR